MSTDSKNRQTEREKAMKTSTSNNIPILLSSIIHPLSTALRGPALLLAATALLLQGCTTARPAWSSKADANPLSRSAFERLEPREGVALVSFNF